MKIIVGLGNYEEKYLKNRHNVGFLFLDYLKEKLVDKNLRWSEEKKFEAQILQIKAVDPINDSTTTKNDIIFVKPLTFMNNSGRAVSKIVSFYKANPKNDLLIAYDDLDLSIGNSKIIKGKSPYKHNGVNSIVASLKTKDFWHVRIGIDGREGNRTIPSEDYVLQNFSNAEREALNTVFDELSKECIILLCA